MRTAVKNPGVRGGSVRERIEAIGWDVTERKSAHAEGGCWEWKGYRASDGYGIIRDDEGRRRQAHRVYYEVLNGPLSPDQLVLHKCDNPPCMNPEHHRIGTHLDNNQDRMVKGRSSHGERHYAHKLTGAQVAEIRSRYKPGVVTQQALADEYGVSQQVISGIVRGKSWQKRTILGVARASIGFTATASGEWS